MNLEQAFSLRSQLFVPALSARFIDKAHERGADAIIVDLEDAIAPTAKREARQALPDVVRRITAQGAPVFVRINNDPALLQEDLEAALATPLAGIFLPKAEDPAQVHAVAERTRKAGTGLVLLLETPPAVLRAAELTACDPETVIGVVFGSEDYANALGVVPTIESMWYAAHAVALAARAHGRAAWGVVGSLAEFGDLALLGKMASSARYAGYTGALAIHPTQVPVLNEAFGASAQELHEAAAIVAAFEQALKQGLGAVQHRGRMLDKPIVDRARRLLDLARRRAERSTA
ncbi:aldolase/citrate lyase family protein [Hydrogenophaga sp.]|uniref:HpcH/HpaI aldolase/citrate lyase family protein n=1 Tax=Hydrogenophaga sp. TaxID=1904254 RepID=UPI002614785B|nr:aldolase/citrate lyase family protein [Hydrogenophaga sp.]MCW5654559.1 HpcH/HpaI aldolase/citrate lyase family protein [Hydrogenophaga sp.]